jgi:hypothetical protein
MSGACAVDLLSVITLLVVVAIVGVIAGIESRQPAADTSGEHLS